LSNIRNKVARGGFSAAFFVQCLRAIGYTEQPSLSPRSSLDGTIGARRKGRRRDGQLVAKDRLEMRPRMLDRLDRGQLLGEPVTLSFELVT
jgi:Domain of unknown function (DUF6471)